MSYMGERTDKKIPEFIPSGDGIWPPKDRLWGKVHRMDSSHVVHVSSQRLSLSLK